MSLSERPLSPHLQIYRPQLTSITSILHRITGAGMALGAPVLTWWLFALHKGSFLIDLGNGRSFDAGYQGFYFFAHSLPGQFMFFCWTFGFIYHFLNGIRHLFWDSGVGVNLKNAYVTGYAILVLSFVVTAFIWSMT